MANLDILIKNSTISDGSGNKPFYGSIGISGDKISFVSNNPEEEIPCADLIDAEGLTVSPEFIDTHSPSEFTLLGMTLDIEKGYYRLRDEYVKAVIKAGGIPLLVPPQDPPSLVNILDGLIIPGGDDPDPSYFNEKPHPLSWIAPRKRKRSDFELSSHRIPNKKE